jgi:hypothetical protein
LWFTTAGPHEGVPAAFGNMVRPIQYMQPFVSQWVQWVAVAMAVVGHTRVGCRTHPVWPPVDGMAA